MVRVLAPRGVLTRLRASPCARCAPVVCVEVSGLLLITRATVGALGWPLLPP